MNNTLNHILNLVGDGPLNEITRRLVLSLLEAANRRLSEVFT